MARLSGLFRQLHASVELRELIKYFLITAASTVSGMALRYILLCFFSGSHTFRLLDIDITVNVDDNFAYTAYYIFSTVVMYLLKWFTARGLKTGSFLPRMAAFVALCLFSMLVGNGVLAVLLSLGMNGEAAFWVTFPVTFVVNYLGTRLIVFRDEQISAQ